MIPKKIHYCWFGKNPLSKMATKCIESWKKYCPGYEIVQWNELNFDIDCCKYVREAYDAKKWAFVTDYVRLYVLYYYGGIYMDTDVEVIRPLDEFLTYRGFSGFESEFDIPTGIMASEAKHHVIKDLMEEYNSRSFLLPNGDLDLTTNVRKITDYFLKKGFERNNKYQIIEEYAFFPKDFFCPKNHSDNELIITENTFTIHHFDGSWLPKKERAKKQVKKIIGTKNAKRFTRIKNYLNECAEKK